MTEEQLSALLRLKRYEQPPAQYFDRLLQDVHRRQRADLLKQPLWRIAMERVQTFFSEHSMSRVTYAGALASVLVVGVTAIGLMTPSTSQPGTSLPAIASFSPSSPQADGRLVSLTDAEEPMLRLEGPKRMFTPDSQPIRSVQMYAPSSPQRYIMDTQPVSNDVPTSF